MPAPLLRRPAPAPYFPPPLFNCSADSSPSGVGNQNLLPSPFKKVVVLLGGGGRRGGDHRTMKTNTHGNSTSCGIWNLEFGIWKLIFSLTSLKIPLLFQLTPRISTWSFFSTPGNSMPSIHLFVFFSGIPSSLGPESVSYL